MRGSHFWTPVRIAPHHVGPIWQQTGYASGNRMWPARLRIQTGLWLPRCPATSSPQRRCSTSRYPQYPPGPTLQNTLLLILTGHVSYAEELEDRRLSSYQTCIALSKLPLPARTLVSHFPLPANPLLLFDLSLLCTLGYDKSRPWCCNHPTSICAALSLHGISHRQFISTRPVSHIPSLLFFCATSLALMTSGP